MATRRLEKSEWHRLQSEYTDKVGKWTESFRARRRVGESHPVHDFLFIYYQYSPAKLEQWHPGIDVWLEDQQLGEFDSRYYRFQQDTILCDPTKIEEKSRSRLRWIAQLLRATQNRTGNYSCLGLHEWAMVYRGDDVRHESTTKLRLSQSEIDQFVESRPVTCSHFDAFRFFADAARPMNKLKPTLDSRVDMEQPSCIHANMDLYKWAFKSMPWVGSELLYKCFELALQARAIDMRASPYDLSKYEDFDPIKIETVRGRDEYRRLQRVIADNARPLRLALAQKIEHILTLAEPLPTQPSS